MKKILLSAFACAPGEGSEKGNGWNWASGLADKGYEIHCLTRRINKNSIETIPVRKNLIFHYVELPFGLEKLYSFNSVTMYLHYILWQLFALKAARKLHRVQKFQVVHHVSWGSIQMGSFLYKLNIPFIFGPAGGGQVAPEAFKSYFLNYWNAELRREQVSRLLLKYNPACKKMLRNAHLVLVSNPDTLQMAQKNGVKNCVFALDTALPNSYFPEENQIKKPEDGKLRLLWVGRFMPRKGLLLAIDVMQTLKDISGISLTIVGYGEMDSEVKSKIEQMGLKDTITMTGKIDYDVVKSYYKSHDVFFFTSLRDSCPAQLLEAMAHGMPVITLDLHGQAILVNSATGVKCSVNSPEKTILELKAAVLSLYNQPDKIQNMSREAIAFARKQTWAEKINAITTDCYPA